MLNVLKEIRLSHELDAAWIIALWKAIHGGDPGPEEIAGRAIAALATQLSPRAAEPAREAGFEQLKARLSELGLHFVEHPAQARPEAGAATTADAVLPPRTRTTRYCFVAPQGEVCAEIVRHAVQKVE